MCGRPDRPQGRKYDLVARAPDGVPHRCQSRRRDGRRRADLRRRRHVAARLESLADPGGICISRTVHENVKNKLPINFEDLGEQHVKNIVEPVQVFRVLLGSTAAAPQRTRQTPRRYWRGGVLSLIGLAIIVDTIVVVQHVSLKPPHTNASIPPQEKPALPLPDKPSIAVLPFANLSNDPQKDYFKRRDYRRPRDRSLAGAGPVRDRSRLYLRLQGQAGKGVANRPRTRGEIPTGGQCAQSSRPGTYQCSTGRRIHGQSSLGATL
jgi:hypothetical protein